MRKEKSSPAVGIAAPVKLTALCRKSNSHLFMPRACFGHIGTLFLSSLQLFFPLCSKFEYFTNTLFFSFFFFHWITHLLEVSAEQNRCTYSSSCTHGTTPAPRPSLSPPHLPPAPASCLFTLHPSVGAIMCPPLVPAQPHALSKTTFIPQCTCIPHVSNSPTMPLRLTGLQRPGFL